MGAVASMEIAWSEKPALDTKAPCKGTIEQVLPEVPAKASRAVFPETGGIPYSPRGLDLKRETCCRLRPRQLTGRLRLLRLPEEARYPA